MINSRMYPDNWSDIIRDAWTEVKGTSKEDAWSKYVEKLLEVSNSAILASSTSDIGHSRFSRKSTTKARRSISLKSRPLEEPVWENQPGSNHPRFLVSLTCTGVYQYHRCAPHVPEDPLWTYKLLMNFPIILCVAAYKKAPGRPVVKQGLAVPSDTFRSTEYQELTWLSRGKQIWKPLTFAIVRVLY